MANNSKASDKKSKGPSPEEILNGFQQLRADQRNFATKLSEFELDLNEHKWVLSKFLTLFVTKLVLWFKVSNWNVKKRKRRQEMFSHGRRYTNRKKSKGRASSASNEQGTAHGIDS